MNSISQTRIGGFGGQGVVLAGTVLGYAGILDGKFVAQSNSYGAAARGGSCKSDIMIANQQIIYPAISRANVFIALCQDAYDKYISTVEAEGVVIHDAQYVTPEDNPGVRHIAVPATKLAIDKLKNRQLANMVILGAFTKITEIISESALAKAIEEYAPKRFLKLDLEAMKMGLSLSV